MGTFTYMFPKAIISKMMSQKCSDFILSKCHIRMSIRWCVRGCVHVQLQDDRILIED